MCGICGTLSLAGEPVSERGLGPMLDAMVHRGPDGEGRLRAPGICAGMRRLAVIDVPGGDQPISNEDGSVSVLFNGEIYNHRELRDDLAARGHRLTTRCDTEVLVHLWEEQGPAMLDRLNGMFAVCLHDRRTGETFLARDRLGIKPLYYTVDGDCLRFASELRVLLRHPDVRVEPDAEALVELFCLQYVAGDRTVYRGVHKLLPGEWLRVRGGSVERRRYWRVPEPFEDRSGVAERDERLRELLESSVRYRLLSDVPLGCFLSGGLDSTIITALAAAARDEPLDTFSVGFDAAEAHDERAWAARAAEALGTRHHELVVSPLDIARELPRLIEHLDEPVTDPALIPTWLLSRFARERVTVALTGEGADELFAGYRRYAYQRRYGWLGRLPGVGQAGEAALGDRLPHRVGQGLGAVAERDPVLNHLRWSAVTAPPLARALFGEEAWRRWQVRARETFAPYFRGDRVHLSDQLRADQSEWLAHDLLSKVDRASMAVSLEARVPFLDHRLVEWAAGLPDRDRIDGGRTKVALRRALGHRVPASILGRAKQGFDLPLAEWIRWPLRETVREALAPDELRSWPGLDPGAVGRLLDEHLGGRQDHGLPLFNLLSIRLFLGRRGSA